MDQIAKLQKYMQTPEAKKKADAAKDKAWTQFTNAFPNADVSQFVSQASIDEKNNFSAEVFFKVGPNNLLSVFGSHRKYWSPEMKTALGVDGVPGFPYQLSPLNKRRVLPIPAIDFTEKAPRIADICSAGNQIYATPGDYFITKFRQIFKQTKPRFTTSVEAKAWLRAPNMKFWTQQLNFAVFCATQGCGISREIFYSGLTLSLQVRSFYQFHVYFTIRRILYELGGIQNISALPGDPTFSEFNNRYDVASYNRICGEFGVVPSSDFRFTHGKNNGLGNVYQYVGGPSKTDLDYPGFFKFSDEGGKGIKGNLIYYIEPDVSTPYDWFAPNTSAGLTQAGLSRINQSIEAFVYCVLGAQVNVRSSILRDGRRAKEAQTEFLTLMEDAIRRPDLAKSVQRYQLAVDQAKVRLNLAVCPGAWLMPARMVINTESTIGYNNKLKQAVEGMKLGVNNDTNLSTKKAALQLMDGGPSKINPPNSHPSNPIHKAAMAAQSPGPKDKQSLEKETASEKPPTEEKPPQHEINKTAVIVGVVGVVALIFIATR